MVDRLAKFGAFLALIYLIVVAPSIWRHGLGKVNIVHDVGIMLAFVFFLFRGRFDDKFRYALIAISSILLSMPFIVEVWANFAAEDLEDGTILGIFSNPIFYFFLAVVIFTLFLALFSIRELVKVLRASEGNNHS